MKNNYVLKRIFIGVAIGVILMLIRGCDVFALTSVDASAGFTNQCRAYYKNSSGNMAYDTGIATNFTNAQGLTEKYCNLPTISTGIYSYVLFSINKNALGTNAPILNSGLKYNFYFYISTDVFSYSQNPVQQNGPNRLTKVKFGTYEINVDSSSQFNCDIEETSNYYDDTIITRRNYKVSCKDVSLVSSQTTWTNLRLFLFIDDTFPTNHLLYGKANFPDLVNVSTTFYYEKTSSIEDVQNSLTDDNVDFTDKWDTNTSNNEYNQFSNINNAFGNLFNLPVYIIQRVRNRLQYADENEIGFTIDRENLPLSSYVNYEDDFTLPPLRNYIYNIIGSTWYETMGGIFGGIIVLKLLLKLGRRLLDLWSFYDIHDDVWGGIE